MPAIDEHHAAIAEHFAALVRTDNYGSGFIDANTEKLWLIEHGAEETVRPLTGNEVLINNCIGQETEAVGSRDAAGLDGTEALVLGGQSLFFASDHSGAHDGRGTLTWQFTVTHLVRRVMSCQSHFRALPILSATLIMVMGLWLCYDSVRPAAPRVPRSVEARP